MTDRATVEIAGQEWALKPLSAPLPHQTDAMRSVSRGRRQREAQTMIQGYQRAVELAKLHGQKEPDPPVKMLQLTNSLLNEHWVDVLEFLDIEDFPEDGGSSISDLEAAVQTFYGARHDDGLSTFEDLNEIYELVSEAWALQVEAVSDVPPLSSVASSTGQASGTTKPSSKRPSQSKAARSKTSATSATSS